MTLARGRRHARILAPTRIGLLVLMTVCLMAARCPFSRKPAARGAAAATPRTVIPDSADQVVQGMSTVLNDNGILKGIVLSDSTYIYEDGSRLELFGVNVVFYTSTGVKDGVMVSRRGTYNARLSRLEARGDVIVKREGGSTLTSPQLVYDQARNQIFTDSSFTLVRPDGQLTGIRFESTPQLRPFNCFSACKATGSVLLPTR